eukprot:m.57055 g.57055  ORF g.57055 m.57055 type:complete len:382 (-) comp6809_c0_seq3:100-1245(-)
MASGGPPPQRPPTKKSSSKEDNLPQLVTSVHFNNKLPSIPFPPKFLPFPFDATRFIRHKDTSLERNYKFKLLFPNNGAIPVELVDPSAYVTPVGARLDAQDEDLARAASSHQEEQRKQLIESTMPWLCKTEYTGSDVRRYGMGGVDNKVKADDADVTHADDRESQVALIEASFAKAKRAPRHPTKPDLTPVEIYPLLPDTKMWVYKFAQVTFDNKPLPPTRRTGAENDVTQLEEALLVNQLEKETGEDFLSYYLPRDLETAQRRKRARLDKSIGDETFDYEKTREYRWEVRNREDNNEDAYVITLSGDGKDKGSLASYNELAQRIRLTVRRREGAQSSAVLRVAHRDWLEAEIADQDTRLEALAPIEDDATKGDAGAAEAD